MVHATNSSTFPITYSVVKKINIEDLLAGKMKAQYKIEFDLKIQPAVWQEIIPSPRIIYNLCLSSN